MLESCELGQEFEEWPLHVTILPWFPATDEAKLDEILGSFARRLKPFFIEVGGVENFGAKKEVAVNIVKPNRTLIALHKRVRKTLDEANMAVHQRDFVGSNYRAHITQQLHAKTHEGEKYQVESF